MVLISYIRIFGDTDKSFIRAMDEGAWVMLESDNRYIYRMQVISHDGKC